MPNRDVKTLRDCSSPSPLLDTIFLATWAQHPQVDVVILIPALTFFFLVRVTFVPWMTVTIADYPLLPSLVDLKLNS